MPPPPAYTELPLTLPWLKNSKKHFMHKHTYQKQKKHQDTFLTSCTQRTVVPHLSSTMSQVCTGPAWVQAVLLQEGGEEEGEDLWAHTAQPLQPCLACRLPQPHPTWVREEEEDLPASTTEPELLPDIHAACCQHTRSRHCTADGSLVPTVCSS